MDTAFYTTSQSVLLVYEIQTHTCQDCRNLVQLTYLVQRKLNKLKEKTEKKTKKDFEKSCGSSTLQFLSFLLSVYVVSTISPIKYLRNEEYLSFSRQTMIMTTQRPSQHLDFFLYKKHLSFKFEQGPI